MNNNASIKHKQVIVTAAWWSWSYPTLGFPLQAHLLLSRGFLGHLLLQHRHVLVEHPLAAATRAIKILMMDPTPRQSLGAVDTNKNKLRIAGGIRAEITLSCFRQTGNKKNKNGVS